MNVENIKVSFINLGYNEKEARPNYPKLGCMFKVFPFKKVWSIQEQLPKDAKKGQCGMIFPFDYTVFHGIDKMRNEGLKGNGLLFCDLDLHDLEQRDRAWDALVKADFSEVLTMSKTKHGIHVIGLCKPTTAKEYHDNALLYLAFLSAEIKAKTGIDLRDIPNAMDTHNTNMGQRFFLCYSPQVWWSTHPCIFELYHETADRLKAEYSMLFEHSQTEKFYDPDLWFESTADVEKIEPVDIPEYIDHTKRWCLFDSICACVNTEKEAMSLWYHAVKYIPTWKHSREFFEKEPKSNSWWTRYQLRPSTYINYDLMRAYGLEAKNKQVRCITHHDKENNFVW